MNFIQQENFKDKKGIYGIVNRINGKTYIGQTGENFLRRYWHHRWKLRANSHDNHHLQKAWNKYGENNFDFIVIEIVTDNNLLDKLEIKYIDLYKKNNKSYNMLLGGGGRRGFPMSDKTKKIIGEKNRKHMIGVKHTEETKIKMSQSRSGRYIHRTTDVLNQDMVREIKAMLINGKKASEVAKELNINYSLINNLISNNTWKTVVVDGWDDYRRNRTTYKRLTSKDHEEICRLYYKNGYDEHELANKYNRTVNMIKIILNKELYDNPVPSLE